MIPTLEIAEARALGTTARVVVHGGRAQDALELMAAQLEELEQACSRFRSDSDLSRVNDGSGRAIRVHPLLVDAVEVALRAATVTDGLVDPTIGRALRLLGYDTDFAAIDQERPAFTLEAQRVPGWKCIVVDRSRNTIRIPAGVQLETVSLRSGGLATSSTTVRRWTQGGAVRHHVLDPATGLPTSGPFRTVSVTEATPTSAGTSDTRSTWWSSGCTWCSRSSPRSGRRDSRLRSSSPPSSAWSRCRPRAST